MDPLPVDEHVGEIVSLVRSERRAIIVAPPGSGKTTRIPPALTALGKTILLQPRRVAARAIARRIASERGWTIGEEIGWHIRFERRSSRYSPSRGNRRNPHRATAIRSASERLQRDRPRRVSRAEHPRPENGPADYVFHLGDAPIGVVIVHHDVKGPKLRAIHLHKSGLVNGKTFGHDRPPGKRV